VQALLKAGSLAVIIVLIAFASARGNSTEPRPLEGTESDRSRAVLDAWLARIPGADTGKVLPVDDAVVQRVFPSRRFYVVRFMRYPRAEVPPPPLDLENLISVGPDRIIQNLENLYALKHFLRSELPPERDKTGARDAIGVCLRLAQEYFQDGFYTFVTPDDSVSVVSEAGRLVLAGKSVVVSGGSGQVNCKLMFRLPSGSVESVSLNGKVRADVRNR